MEGIMEFLIGDKYKLSTDKYCVIISKKEKNKADIRWRNKWYYPDFETALAGLIDRDIKNVEKLEFIVDHITQLKADIFGSGYDNYGRREDRVKIC